MDSTFGSPSAADCPSGLDTLTTEATSTPAASAVSQIPSTVLEHITIGPAAPWVIERTVNMEERKDGGSNPIFLLDGQHHAGCYESYKRVVSRLDTTSVVNEASQWRLNFDPSIQRLTIHSLIVRRGDRAVDNAQADRLRVLHREGALDSAEWFTVLVQLEDVRIGDVLDLSFTVHSPHPIFPNHFFALATVPGGAVRDFHLDVRFPKAHAMKWNSNDPELKPAEREEGDETVWSWHLRNLSGYTPERNVPRWHFVERWIQVSDFPSWAEVASGFLAAWPQDLQNAELIRISETISTDAATPVLRLERALTYLQDDVRFVSTGADLADRVPAPPGIVLKRGFGDSQDKTCAAAQLLRLLGVSARPVLVNTGRRQSIRDYLPMPVFNHAILEFEVDGRRRWVDVTESLQGGSALLRPIARYRVGLPLGPGVEDLEAIESDEANDRTELQETFLLDSSGRASSLRVQVTVTGREAEKWRRALAHDGVEAFAHQREHQYQQLYAGAIRVGRLDWHDDREKNELVAAEVFDLRDVLFHAPESNTFLFRLQAHAIQSILGFSESGRRRHPWELRFPCRVRHVIEIESSELPQTLGRSAQVDANTFRFSCQSQQRPGYTSITYLLQMLADHVPAEEFEAHKAKVREVLPQTVVMGQLPRDSVVPWKKRSADNLLPRADQRGPKTPVARPDIIADADSQTVALDPTSPEAVAPPLSSKSTRDNETPGLRPIKAPRGKEAPEVRERGAVNRPNPAPMPEGTTTPWKGSRRKHSIRRQRRQRQRLKMWIGAILGGLLLAGMILVLLHGK